MRSISLLAVGIAATAVAGAPVDDISAVPSVVHGEYHYRRENLCNLKAPPALCQPNASITVEETAQRAYNFYRAFVVDGDPKTMFSLIDSTYKVS